jgi:two-component system sensor histidine kinase DegS
MLDHLGLVPTLQHYADSVSAQTGMTVTIHESQSPIMLPPMMAKYLYRATRELINNAAKHGKARQVLVNVYWEPAQLRLVVDDDGVGFDVSMIDKSSPSHGLGLATIREHVRSLRGRFRIESSRDAGTRVVLEVPLTGSDSP